MRRGKRFLARWERYFGAANKRFRGYRSERGEILLGKYLLPNELQRFDSLSMNYIPIITLDH